MRPDQVERLKELTEKLADRFLMDADPSEWPGDGKSPADLTQQERGDAYWSKKNAMATGGVLRYTKLIFRRTVWTRMLTWTKRSKRLSAERLLP